MRKENADSSTDSAAPEGDAEESFLGRWSRRKQRARSGQDAPPEPTPPEGTVTPDGDKPAERVLTDEDMPPLDSLDEDSDYSEFLSPGVSESLRNAALRKMFLSPKFNVVDGLDDYADDFTKFAPLGDIVTSDMRHQMELAEERAKQALERELDAEKGALPADTAAAESQGNAEADQSSESLASGSDPRPNEDPSSDPAQDPASDDEPRSS